MAAPLITSAFPINIRNNGTGPIGVIVVSGLPQLKDHQVSVKVVTANLSSS